jgi:hypothetical protein
MNPHLDFLLSCLYDDFLGADHRADLHKSSLTDATIRLQKIRSVPPHMIEHQQLLGFATPQVISAYLIRFADPRGGWMNHPRMKIFPALTTTRGTIKYLQPRDSGVRIFFPVATLPAVLHTADPLYAIEGEKKSLSVAQLGLPAIGFCGIEGLHVKDSRDLHPDLDDVGLRGRVVNIIPDGDWRTNVAVNRAVNQLAAALERRGAHPQIISLPEVAA